MDFSALQAHGCETPWNFYVPPGASSPTFAILISNFLSIVCRSHANAVLVFLFHFGYAT